MIQLWVTLFTGVLGIGAMYFWHLHLDFSLHWVLLLVGISLAGLIILSLLFFRLEGVVQWALRFPRWKKQIRFVHVLDHLNRSDFLTVYGLSFIRYLVFLAQYLILFDLFKIHLTVVALVSSVSVVFLVMSILPSLAMLTELGIRGQTSLSIFKMFTPNLVGILAVTFSVWIINLVVPAFIGGIIFLYRPKDQEDEMKEDPTGSSNFDA